jgi:hypothetical protein
MGDILRVGQMWRLRAGRASARPGKTSRALKLRECVVLHELRRNAAKNV